ncbi:MAG: hypothetical protein HYS44_00200 [Candidatus Niyogibacteria bacterium]|nr:hypothetical protein [Candidatus Niyogibacteria bacterium]
MVKMNHDFKAITASILKKLSGRSRDIIERRFGIGARARRQTLESIGRPYKITRERVRQIEAVTLGKIRESAAFALADPVIDTFRKEIERKGGVWKEDGLLSECSSDSAVQNSARFLLTLSPSFLRVGADDHCHHHWTTDGAISKKAREALRDFSGTLGEKLMSENELADRFGEHVRATVSRSISRDALFSWLDISKSIRRNPFGEWGHASSPLVHPRGMRDYAYLVLKKHGSPLHFREVAKAIETMIGRPAHVQTVHNELIKDERFILVGRGLYALSNWGYQPGIVRDIITVVLKTQGPLGRDELVKRVQKERHVKENTILINLQNKQYFKKLSDGRYHVA